LAAGSPSDTAGRLGLEPMVHLSSAASRRTPAVAESGCAPAVAPLTVATEASSRPTRKPAGFHLPADRSSEQLRACDPCDSALHRHGNLDEL
jgi:hypothetical protein